MSIRSRLKYYLNWTRAPYKRDLFLSTIAFVSFLLFTFLVCIANSYADRTNTNDLITDVSQKYVAPDLIQNPASRWYRTTSLPDQLPDTLVGLASGLILLRGVTLGPWALTFFRRFMYTASALYFLRALTVSFTVIPTPFLTCPITFHSNLLYDALLLFFQQRTACGDVFFSGHAIIFSLCISVYMTYSRYYIINALVTLFCCFGMSTLLMSGYHYTIDVVIAFVLSILFWTLLHWFLWIPVLQGTILGQFFIYLDSSQLNSHPPHFLTENSHVVDVVVLPQEPHLPISYPPPIMVQVSPPSSDSRIQIY